MIGGCAASSPARFCSNRGANSADLGSGVSHQNPYFRGLRLGFIVCLTCTTLTRAGAVIVINEIHYNPDVKTEPVQFIQHLNAGSNTVYWAGWYFSDGLKFAFPP